MPTVILPNSESVSAEQKNVSLKHWVVTAASRELAHHRIQRGARVIELPKQQTLHGEEGMCSGGATGWRRPDNDSCFRCGCGAELRGRRRSGVEGETLRGSRGEW